MGGLTWLEIRYGWTASKSPTSEQVVMIDWSLVNGLVHVDGSCRSIEKSIVIQGTRTCCMEKGVVYGGNRRKDSIV